jgi:hypothetical protein
MVIAMLDLPELVAVTRQKRIRFGAALHRPGFATAWPIRNQIRGQDPEHLIDKFLALAPGACLQQGLTIAARAGKTPRAPDGAEQLLT